MNYYDIETFLMIVKTKSITKTAEKLFLSQPTISHRLKSLETELNMHLITRKKGYKTVELTAKGEEFVPLAERWISLWKETHMLRLGEEKLYLTIGCIDTFSTTVLKPIYQEALQQKAPISIRIRTHQSQELYGLLERHEIDIGFVYHQLFFKNVILDPIISEKMYLVQSIHTEKKKALLHTDEMDQDYELFFNWETSYEIWHEQWLNKNRIPRIQVDSLGLICNLLENEKLWMIAPASVVREMAKQQPIFVSEIANEVAPPERITYQISHKNASATTQKAVEVFKALIDSHVNLPRMGTVDIMEINNYCNSKYRKN